MKIAVVLNTRNEASEFQVEYDPPHTIELIKHGIIKAGHEYEFIEADENIVDHLKKVKPDLVFNRAEGIRGESRVSHAIGLNKTWAKKCLAYHKVLTPRFKTITDINEIKNFDVPFPVILKPNEEGSSMGINEDNVVRGLSELEEIC